MENEKIKYCYQLQFYRYESEKWFAIDSYLTEEDASEAMQAAKREVEHIERFARRKSQFRVINLNTNKVVDA